MLETHGSQGYVVTTVRAFEEVPPDYHTACSDEGGGGGGNGNGNGKG